MSFLKRIWRRFEPSVEEEVAGPVPDAVLTHEERKLTDVAAEQLRQAQHQVQLLALAHQTAWWRIRQKYGLPEEFDYVPATGEVFGKNGKDPPPAGE